MTDETYYVDFMFATSKSFKACFNIILPVTNSNNSNFPSLMSMTYNMDLHSAGVAG